MESIFQKFYTVDYISDPTPRANVWISRFKEGVTARASSCHHQASVFCF